VHKPELEISLRLPHWVDGAIRQASVYPSASAKMEFVLDVLSAHIMHGTGYPFAAAVFDTDHKVSAIGVNNSLALNNSTAHAELLALQFAQQGVGRPYFPRAGAYTLVTSAEPCAMCCGAVFSSGIRELVVAASASDVEEILGFGPGPVHPQWREFFAAKQIVTVEGVGRDRARTLLLEHRERLRAPQAPRIDRVGGESLPGAAGC